MITNYCNDKNKCTRCGRCCTDFAFISDGEIHLIKDYLKAHPEIKEQWKTVINGNVYMFCPFYSADQRKCLIYKVRPKICRLFKCNKDPKVIEEQKKEFTASKYHNVTDIMSWHRIFFNNWLQEWCVHSDAKKGKIPL